MSCLMSLIFLFLPLSAFSGKPLDRAEIQAKLRSVLVGKVAILQKFYTNNDLHFDSAGRLIGSSPTGAWTSYAGIEVASVHLSSRSLILTGKRNVRRWRGDELGNYSLETPVRIEIDLRPDGSQADLLSALETVFISRNQRLSDIVPDYWKGFLTTERGRSAAWQQKQSELRKDVKAMTPQDTAPRLLSGPEGIVLSATQPGETDDNTLTFSFIVDQNGSVRDIQILKPVGLGADDTIAERVSRWKFAPAVSGSRPVAVQMYGRIEVRFPTGRRVDPYHTNECPNTPNLYAC